MELDRQQYLENFLHMVKSSKSKNEFMKNVQSFDQKYTQSYPIMNNQNSLQSFPSVPQMQAKSHQKIRNPFLNNTVDPQLHQNNRNYSPINRTNNFIQTQQQNQHYQPNYTQKPNPLLNNQNKINGGFPKTQHSFYRNDSSKQFNNFNRNKHGNQQPQSYRQEYEHQNFQPHQSTQNWGQYNQARQLQINVKSAHYTPKQQSNIQHQHSQFDEMNRKFGKMFIQNNNQYEIFNRNPNDLSVNSKHNFNQGGSNPLQGNPNEFLPNIPQQNEPDFVKYYKMLVPVHPTNKAHNPNQRVFTDKRMNQFANQ